MSTKKENGETVELGEIVELGEPVKISGPVKISETMKSEARTLEHDVELSGILFYKVPDTLHEIQELV